MQNEDTEEEKEQNKSSENQIIKEPMVNMTREFIAILTDSSTPISTKRKMLMEYVLVLM